MRPFWVICILISTLLLLGCGKSKEKLAQDVKRERQGLQKKADEVINKIQYIKDPRTGICYAYYMDDSVNGGPAIAVVSEKNIPSDLITTARISKK